MIVKLRDSAGKDMLINTDYIVGVIYDGHNQSRIRVRDGHVYEIATTVDRIEQLIFESGAGIVVNPKLKGEDRK